MVYPSIFIRPYEVVYRSAVVVRSRPVFVIKKKKPKSKPKRKISYLERGMRNAGLEYYNGPGKPTGEY